MSKFDPLVINNPTGIGVVRFELYGDRDAARLHLHEARKWLGSLKQVHGVNSNNEESGSHGYFARGMMLEDGTKLTMTTNNGQDIVRIETPFRKPEQEAPKKKPPELASNVPDLWVGARIISGGLDSTGVQYADLHLCVWEPTSDPTNPNILSNRDILFFDGKLALDIVPDAISYPLGRNDEIHHTNLEVYTDKQPTDIFYNGDYSRFKHFVDHEGVEWDAVIRNKKGRTPTGGVYYVKVMAVGNDCYILTPVVCEVKVIVGGFGKYSASEKHHITFTKWTIYRRGALPKGWYGAKYVDPNNSDSCYTCGTHPDDYGDNPHAEHWWQGGFKVFVPPAMSNEPVTKVLGAEIGVTDKLLRTPTGFAIGSQFPKVEDICSLCDTDTEYIVLISLLNNKASAFLPIYTLDNNISTGLPTDVMNQAEVPGFIELTGSFFGRKEFINILPNDPYLFPTDNHLTQDTATELYETAFKIIRTIKEDATHTQRLEYWHSYSLSTAADYYSYPGVETPVGNGFPTGNIKKRIIKCTKNYNLQV